MLGIWPQVLGQQLGRRGEAIVYASLAAVLVLGCCLAILHSSSSEYTCRCWGSSWGGVATLLRRCDLC